MLKNILKLGTLLAIATTAMASPLTDHGQLSVTNGELVDKNGKAPQLRGMSLFWDQWATGWYNSSAVNNLASTWKADVVRAAISSYDVNRTKSMIDWAISAGIYIVVDNHSHKAHLDQSNAVNYFKTIAQYVASKSGKEAVIYEIYNEPVCSDGGDPASGCPGGYTTWAQIKTYAQAVIAAIRQYDTKNIIVIGTPKFSQGVGEAQANPLSGNNLVYAFHFYASELSHMNLQGVVRSSHCSKFPIMVTEWGTSWANGDKGPKGEGYNWTNIRSWMGLMESAKLSWMNWSLYDKPELASALQGGASTSGPWNNLTESGNFVKTAMVNYASGGTVSGVTSSAIDCSYLSSSSIAKTGGTWAGNVLEAENYQTVSGATEIANSSASSKAYMGNIQEGAQLKYWIDAEEAGWYNVSIGFASISGTPKFSYTVNGQTQSGDIPNSGSATTFKVHSSHVKLAFGKQDVSLSLTGVSAGLGVDYLLFMKADSADSAKYAAEPVSLVAKEKKLGYSWAGKSIQVATGSEAEFVSFTLYSLRGKKIKSWGFGDAKDVISFEPHKITQESVLFAVLRTRSGMQSVKIPVLH